ncbi:MAG: hypothetical protein AAF660_00195 [Pseudomonadota bacterium]
MSHKHNDTDVRGALLKNEFSRQRWELFHRAIAHAKQSNDAALENTDLDSSDTKASGPFLSIVR